VAVEPDLPPDQVVVDSSSWVTWALGQLPEREREVLACMEVVDLDTAATASALGLTKSAVRVARHRGLRRLRALAGGPAVEAARQWS
jgi:RNA polymerase sigma-70 factor (ECF subfamily)